MKRIIIIALAVILVLSVAVWAFAASNAGSQDDPLVTVSYLNDKFKADLVKEFEAKITAQGAELAAKIDEKLGAASGGSTSQADAFYLVTLSAGQTLRCDVGTEVLLREGAFTVSGAAVTDTTSGSAVAVGSTAANNHMFVAAAGSGFTLGGASGTVLVRGTYTIV